METDILDNERYLFGVAVRKVVVAVIGGGMGLATKYGVFKYLEAHGVTVNIDPNKLQEALILSGMGVFTLVHDWVKLKTGWTWL